MCHRNRLGRTRQGVGVIVLLAVVGMSPMAAWAEDEKGNMVFFRGGWAGLTSGRGCETFTDVGTAVPSSCGTNNANTGYYVGGGLDLMLSKNLWGMMERIAAVGEIGVEFKRFDSHTTAQAIPAVLGANQRAKTQVTMLTVDIAPKIKFRQGSDFQPWIIPVGLDFHVISPPSNQVSYLDIGVQVGAGAEYRVWKELKLGVDGRFHLASNQTNTVNNYGTVGAYLGIGF